MEEKEGRNPDDCCCCSIAQTTRGRTCAREAAASSADARASRGGLGRAANRQRKTIKARTRGSRRSR